MTTVYGAQNPGEPADTEPGWASFLAPLPRDAEGRELVRTPEE